VYRNQSGFSIAGKNTHGISVRVFARTEAGAREIVAAIKRGDHDAVLAVLLEGR
jgi:hypothetical protein